MRLSEKLVWKLYSGVLGTVSTIIVQKALVRVWHIATGETPPDPNDPEVPFSEAVTWAIAAGIGVGITQLSINRYMTRQWNSNMGGTAPSNLKNRLASAKG